MIRITPPARRAAVTVTALLCLLRSAGAQSPAPSAASPAGAEPGSAARALLAGAPLLTEEQMRRLEKVIGEQGSSVSLPPSLTSALLLSTPQVAPTVRQAAFEDAGGPRHGFALLNDGSGYFLFARGTDRSVSGFHVDRAFHLVAAASSGADGRFLRLAGAAAQDQLGAEIRAWSLALSPRGVTLPPPKAPGK